MLYARLLCSTWLITSTFATIIHMLKGAEIDPRVRLKKLVNRLRRESSPHLDNLQQQTLDIQSLINAAEGPPNDNQFISAYQKIVSSRGQPESPNRSESNQDENIVLAYLFSSSRVIFNEQEETKQTSERRIYDESLEVLEIRGVLDLLNGDQLETDYNTGKTSVILPIASIAISIFSGKKPVLMGVNDDLVTKLYKNTKAFAQHLPAEIQNGGFEVKSFNPQTEKTTNDKSVEALLIQQYKEDHRPESVKAQTAQLYWKELLTRPNLLAVKINSTIPGVIVSKVDDVVFELSPFPKAWGKVKALADELHIVGEQPSPYVVTTKEPYIPLKDLINMTNLWILQKVMIDTLTDQDFAVNEGQYELNDAAWSKVEKIAKRKRSLLNHSSVRKAIKSINTYLGGDEEMRELILEDFTQWWFHLPTTAEVESPVETRTGLCRALASELTDFKNYPEGTVYYFDDKDQLQVRHDYLAISLEDRYLPALSAITALALHDKFQFVNISPILYTGIQFPTFVDMVLNGDLASTSASYAFIDPETKKRQTTPFARFLTDITCSNLAILERAGREDKTCPTPIITTKKEAVSLMTKQLADKQPTLIISWGNEKQGEELFQQIITEYPDLGNRVGFVGADAKKSYIGSGPERIQTTSENVYKKLETGELLFAISTGSAGLGTDIVHPDLRVIGYNLPKTRIQLLQAWARRRAKGNKFSWYIEKELIDLKKTRVSKETSLFDKLFGGGSLSQFETMLADEKSWLSAIFMLLQLDEELLVQDFTAIRHAETAFHTDFLPNIIRPLVESTVEQRLKNTGLAENVYSGYLAQKLWEVIYGFIGIPEDAYWNLFNAMTEASLDATSKESFYAFFREHYEKKVRELIPGWVNDRFGDAAEKVSYILTSLETALTNSDIKPDNLKELAFAFPYEDPTGSLNALYTAWNIPYTEIGYDANLEGTIVMAETLRISPIPIGYVVSRQNEGEKKYTPYLLKNKTLYFLGRPLYSPQDNYPFEFTPVEIDSNQTVKTVPILAEKTEGVVLGILKS